MADGSQDTPGISGLHLVATPIGNLSDISGRACRTLQDVSFIAAEDTRVARRLLSHLGIRKPLVSCRAHNERDAAAVIVGRILSGESCAFVTDAGTPGISDPGEALVLACIKSGIPVTVVPGPCAAISALVLSGLPTGRFVFEGFLPAARGRRMAHLRQLACETRTMIFYEAPHKLERTLQDMFEVFGDRRLAISRELTKLFEETLRMTLSDAVSYFNGHPPRGEFALVVEGAPYPAMPAGGDEGAEARALEIANALVTEGLPVRAAAKKAAQATGCSANRIYGEIVKGKTQRL